MASVEIPREFAELASLDLNPELRRGAAIQFALIRLIDPIDQATLLYSEPVSRLLLFLPFAILFDLVLIIGQRSTLRFA